MTAPEKAKLQKIESELSNADLFLTKFFRAIEQGKAPGECRGDFESAARSVKLALADVTKFSR